MNGSSSSPSVACNEFSPLIMSDVDTMELVTHAENHTHGSNKRSFTTRLARTKQVFVATCCGVMGLLLFRREIIRFSSSPASSLSTIHHFELGSSSLRSSSSTKSCGTFSNIVFADMHDGDQKLVTLQADQLTIQPATAIPSSTMNKEPTTTTSWIVKATMNLSTCTAMVDFNVPGKPSPPPVPLLATLYKMEPIHVANDYHQQYYYYYYHHHAKPLEKMTWEFSDPSETIAPSKETPLNHWVQVQ